jgi:hypothetical protein
MTYRGGRGGRCGAAQATALGQIRSIAPHVRQQRRCADCGRLGRGKKANAPLDGDWYATNISVVWEEAHPPSESTA